MASSRRNGRKLIGSRLCCTDFDAQGQAVASDSTPLLSVNDREAREPNATAERPPTAILEVVSTYEENPVAPLPFLVRELLEYIFKYLSPRDLLRASWVCAR